MEKINSFMITKVSMTGFKCFKDTTSFDFGDRTFITASNNQGKSSIAEAIAFVFMGTQFFGEKGLDRLRNSGVNEMRVSVDLIDGTGEPHNLTRIRKHDATTVAFDGLNVRQSDVNSVFGDKDVFLSILNPLYFINILGDNGKALLEKLLPVVSHDEVIEALPKSSRDILVGQKLISPETFIKNRRDELRELEEALIGYRSQQELLNYQREDRANKLKEMQAAVDAITIEMTELEDVRDSGRDLTAEKLTLEELHKYRNTLVSDAWQKTTDQTIQDLMNKIKAIEMSIAKQDAKLYVSSHAARIIEAEADLKVLIDEYNKLNTALSNAVVGYNCPACASVITIENIDSIKADLQRRISALVSDGTAAKARLSEIKEQDNTDKCGFETQKAAMLAAEHRKLDSLNQQLREINIAHELDAEYYYERLTSIDSKIKEYERRLVNGNLTSEQVLRLARLGEAKREYAAQIKALSGVTDYNFASLIAETEDEIIRLKRLISESIQYMAKRIELTLDGLKMSNTEIVLTEIVKTTGEIKDCFRFSYDGRDYKYLSLSEKIRAGLEVSLLIQRLSGRNYPIFIDNGESICSFGNIRPTGQVILSRVVSGGTLQVTYKNREQKDEAA